MLLDLDLLSQHSNNHSSLLSYLSTYLPAPFSNHSRLRYVFCTSCTKPRYVRCGGHLVYPFYLPSACHTRSNIVATCSLGYLVALGSTVSRHISPTGYTRGSLAAGSVSLGSWSSLYSMKSWMCRSNSAVCLVFFVRSQDSMIHFAGSGGVRRELARFLVGLAVTVHCGIEVGCGWARLGKGSYAQRTFPAVLMGPAYVILNGLTYRCDYTPPVRGTLSSSDRNL